MMGVGNSFAKASAATIGKSADTSSTAFLCTGRSKQSCQRYTTTSSSTTVPRAVSECPSVVGTSWLCEEEPVEALYLRTLKRKELECTKRAEVAKLDAAPRARFLAYRRFVQDHQRAVSRGLDVHWRTLDLGLEFTENYLLHHCKLQSGGAAATSSTGRVLGRSRGRTSLPGGGLGFGSSGAAVRIPCRELTLLANVALWVACKVEELQPPLVDTFLKASGLDEFYAFEMDLATATNWAFNPVCSSDYLAFFMANEELSGRQVSIERHLTNLVQRSELWFQHGLLELIVACIVLGGAYTADERLMISANVVSVSGAGYRELVACVDAVHDYLHGLAVGGDRCLEAARYPSLGSRIKVWEPSTAAAPAPAAALEDKVAEQRALVWRGRSRALSVAFS